MTTPKPRTVSDTISSPRSHLAATALLNNSIEVKQDIQSVDDAEPPTMSGPIVVRRLSPMPYCPSLATCTIQTMLVFPVNEHLRSF